MSASCSLFLGLKCNSISNEIAFGIEKWYKNHPGNAFVKKVNPDIAIMPFAFLGLVEGVIQTALEAPFFLFTKAVELDESSLIVRAKNGFSKGSKASFRVVTATINGLSHNHHSFTSTLFNKFSNWRNESPNFFRKATCELAFIPIALLGLIEGIAKGILAIPLYVFGKCVKLDSSSSIVKLKNDFVDAAKASLLVALVSGTFALINNIRHERLGRMKSKNLDWKF